MDFRLLGPFEVICGTAPVRVAAGKQRALLAILLLNANKTVPRDRIVDELWGDDVPESAQKMVQIHVSQLRKALPEPRLQTRAPGYVLEVADEELDLGRFQRLVAAGRKALADGDAGTAAELLRRGLGLWRGPALAEFSEPFARHEGARLEEQRAAALEWRVEADLALGDHADVVGELEALIARHPLRERLRSQQMLALYRSGRHAEALDVYQAFRRMLDEELGIDPPAGLKDLERRMLRQDPSLDAPGGAPVAQAAPAADGAATTVGGAAVERPAGRERELAHLERLLDEARAGERRLVFVTGEAGIGKTTVVDGFLSAATGTAELLVGHGRCVEHRGAGEPYLPVLEALARLCRQPGGETVLELLSRHAPTWLAQMPWLVPADELEAIQRRLTGATHERMLRELLEALDEISSRATLALVLEDLHWSDPSTIDLLDAFARRRERARLFVICTFRRGDTLAPAQSVYELEQGLRVRGLCAEVAVGALSREALDTYLAGRFAPATPPAGLARLLRERTGGRPLFVRMLLDSWFDQGLLGGKGGGADLGLLSGDVPETVRDLIEQLLRQLDPHDVRLLGSASVVGKEFSAAAVAAAVDHAEEAVEARCDALARTGRFLETAGEEAWPDGTVASRYEFGHDLQREVLYDLLPAGERARMHARVGARLEQAYAHEDGAAGLLAWHFARARDAVKAIAYLGAAAEQALRRNAHREAVAHLSDALGLLDRLPAGRERDERELALLTTLGTAQVTVRGSTDPAVSETYARARQVSTRLGDGARRFPEEPPAARSSTRDGPARPPSIGQRNGLGQEVRFCIAPDGARIAYAVHGRGPPLVRTATWLTHLEFDWGSPVWRHWLAGLAEHHLVLRYDERGCGLSDRDVEDFSLDARVADLEAVVDAAGIERLTLLGMSQGGPVAVEYAARHPERVSHLILYATYARGRLMRDPSPSAREQSELMISLIRMGWAQDQPAFRRLFTTLFIPDATSEQMEWFDELQRATTDAETAVRIRTARNHDEVTGAAARVRSPTLVLHPRHDALVPFSEGRLLATLIPRAQLVPLESRNHILLEDEPAWAQFRAELDAFLRPTERDIDDRAHELSKP